MDAVEYIKTKQRMCEQESCLHCKFILNGKYKSCARFQIDFPEEATKIVEEWGKEHRATTNLQHVVETLRKLGYVVEEKELKKLCPPPKDNHFTGEYIGCSGNPCSACEKWWDKEWKGEEK